jgi:hypothetical protein
LDKHEQIRQGILNLAAKVSPLQTLLGEVTEVNETEFTCVIKDDDGLEYLAHLRCVLNGNESITFFPAVGTYALVIRIEDAEMWMVVACDKIDKSRTKIGTTRIEQTAQGFLIQKGSDTLKDAIQLIVEAVQPIVVLYGNNPDYAKLAQALTKINNLLL